jgi:signal peptidase II
LKNLLKHYAFLLPLVAVVVALDQWTKYLVKTNIPLGETWSPWSWLSPYARIVHWSNTGAAFGIFQNMGDVFMVLSIIVAAAIFIYFPRVPREEWPLRIAMGLQMGGAIGNLIDRLTQGYVTDFISVGRFAVFNIADASISCGVAVLVIGVWIKDHWQQERKSEQPDSSV